MPLIAGSACRRIVTATLRMAVAVSLLALTVACTLPDQDSVAWPTDEWQSTIRDELDADKVTWPTDGWPTSTPEEQGMDSARLQQMMDFIDRERFTHVYDSVIVVRHGSIVFEAYRNGYDQDTKHHIQSATKSFSSMLIGIAIHEGFLDGVEQKLVDLFPDHTIANLDARKQRLTLEHLLTMSDGMDWHEHDFAYTDPRNTLGQMWVSRDAVQHVLDQPMAREPGESWAYNSGTSILLGGILEEATGQDVLAFAREHLFGPIGIEDVTWSKTTGGHYHTDGGLYLTPRDMARFGYLVLHGGSWDGQEIVSPEWVARSTEAHYQASAGKGYGYQWWTLERGIFQAMGHYEQIIYVVPEADMVVVLTGNVPDRVISPTDGLLFRYILNACTDLPPELARHTYADHGFTFEYPNGYTVQETPLPGGDALSPEGGTVQFRFFSYPFELIQALWVQAEPGLDLELYLAEFAKSASQPAGIVYSMGESGAYTQGNHKGIYHLFDYEESNLQLRGATVAWYCEESQRVWVLSYATSPGISDPDLTARFKEHLDSFGCHPAD